MYKVVKREEIGLPSIVTSSDGSPRPSIGENNPWYTAHYTGVYVKYGDPGDTPQEILNLESVARNLKKPFEYNYVIGTDEDPFIYEYAGTFRAAHSAGENGEAVGVLFFNGIDEPLTNTQVDKFRWLRDEVLIPFKVLKPDVATTPHKDMPGAATACPNNHVMSRWDELIARWSAPVTPEPVPPPTNPPANTGITTTVQSGQTIWSIAREMYDGSDPVGITVEAILKANNITSTTVIHPGHVLLLPGKMNLA